MGKVDKIMGVFSDLFFDKTSSRIIHNSIIQKTSAASANTDREDATSKIDFTKTPFKKIDFLQSLESAAGKAFPDPFELQTEFADPTRCDIRNFLQDLCRQKDVQTTPTTSLSKLLDKLFGHFVEPSLIDPTFVMDHPVCMSPLAKEHRSRPGDVLKF